jgi:ABC-type glycerol-3-phosphate transport system substrate-binding protein
MKRKILSLILVLAFGLTACGGTKATEAPAVGMETPVKVEEPVVLRMWVHTNNAFIAGYEPLIAAYESAHPNVDIQLENFDYELYLQTLQTAMPAGEEADILQLFGTWTSQYYERLAPVPSARI